MSEEKKEEVVVEVVQQKQAPSCCFSYRSQNIDQIAGALAKAQGSYDKLESNQIAPGGKYANLDATFKAVKKGLSQNGISIYQHTLLGDESKGPKILETILMHSSGQWISTQERIVPGNTWRSTGNTYEIVKRLQAQMILGVAPSDNDPIAFDDNGEEHAQLELINELKDPNASKKQLDREETITNEQYHEILAELDGYPSIARDILSAYKLESLADLPKSEFYKTRAQIVRIKETSSKYLKKK